MRARLDPARHRRQRRAHQNRRRQEEDAGGDGAEDEADRAGTAPRRVDVRESRHAEEDEEPEHADGDLDERIDAQRMLARRDVARQQEAAETHAAHERAEQHSQRHRRRANHELEELEPDDLVNQGGAAAGDKQQQQRGHIASRGHQGTLDDVVSGPGWRLSYPAAAGLFHALLWPSGERRDAITLRRGGMIPGMALYRDPLMAVLAALACDWRPSRRPRRPCSARRRGRESSPSATSTGRSISSWKFCRPRASSTPSGNGRAARPCFIQTGDIFDRGAKVREALDLLMRLEDEAKRAGGRVESLLGNHEAMNLLHEFRDVSPASLCRVRRHPVGIAAATRLRRLRQARQAARRRQAKPPPDRDAWMASHPPGFLEYVDALGPRGKYGRWLRSHKVVINEGGTAFMHAGVRADMPGTFDDINTQAAKEIAAWDDTKAAMVKAQIVPVFCTLPEAVEAAVAELQRISAALQSSAPPGDHVTREFVEQLQALLAVGKSSLFEPEGPLWFRGFATWPDNQERQRYAGHAAPGEVRRRTVRHRAHAVSRDGSCRASPTASS